MRRRVVITGRGVVSPIGIGVVPFFEGLRTAQSGIEEIHSFDAHTLTTHIAGEVRNLNFSQVALPKVLEPALRRDRKSVFGLVAAREALVQAFGLANPTAHYSSQRLGVMVAAGLEIFHLQDLVSHLHQGTILGQSFLQDICQAPAFSQGQIPAHLGAQQIAREASAEGLFTVNLSACAAGTQAIGEAFLAIREGVLDAAITGGYDSMVNPLGVGGFTLLHALSTCNELRGAASRPFDVKRDGFVLGEGAAMLVLEELSAAQQRSATIYAEVLGYASTLDGYRITDPAPDQVGAKAAMERALADAQISPEEIDYINAHGTGTLLNDPAETAAIRAVFGAKARQLPVSSTKSQIGHLIGAAGAVEFLAGLFALQKGILPATINLTEPDPECDLDYVPLTPRPAVVRTFMSNSFGFGGQNAVIIAGSPRD